MDALVKLALIGTAKARTAEHALPSALAAPVIDKFQLDDPSRRLLIAAGAEFVCQRCGFSRWPVYYRPAPAGTDAGLPCSPQLASLLQQAMATKQPRQVEEFFGRV